MVARVAKAMRFCSRLIAGVRRQRMNKPPISQIAHSVASLMVSGVAFYLSVHAVRTAGQLIEVVFPLFYAILTTLFLVEAWRTGSALYSRAAFWLAAVLSSLLVAGSMDVGMISGLELMVILVVVPAFSMNWLATRGAVAHRKSG